TPSNVATDYNTTPVHYDTASGPGTYAGGVGMIADSFTIRASRYLASVFDDLTVLGVPQVTGDNGVAAAKMLVNSSVVVIEVAERSLVTGQYTLLNSATGNTILTALAEHPRR